jgi:hypothetical protein
VQAEEVAVLTLGFKTVFPADLEVAQVRVVPAALAVQVTHLLLVRFKVMRVV